MQSETARIQGRAILVNRYSSEHTEGTRVRAAVFKSHIHKTAINMKDVINIVQHATFRCKATQSIIYKCT